MARGQSPYQGRYVVPQVDFSPIAQGGRDIGAALSSIGGSIGSAVVKRKELKGKLDTYSKMIKGMEADVELYLDADPEERKRVASMIKELDQETRADPSKNLIQKVAAYEAAMPILRSRLDDSFRERKFKEDKAHKDRMAGLMYPPMPSLDGMPSPQAGGAGTPLVPDPSSLVPATPPPPVTDPSSFIPASQPPAIEPDLDTLNELTPDPQSVPPVGRTEPAPVDTQPQPVPEGEIGSWEEFDEAGGELDRLQRKEAIPDVPEGFDSWEEYKNVQQMDLWDEAKGSPGPVGAAGVVAQPLLKPDEAISREIADKLGLDIPTKAFRAPSPLTDKEKEHLNKLRSDPAFLSHPRGGSFFRATLARLEAKEKALREWPIKKIDHLRNMVALRSELFEIDRENKMPDLTDSGVRAKHIEEQTDVYDALGFKVDWTWSGGKLTASIEGVEGAKDMVPVRWVDENGVKHTASNQFRLPGSSVTHILDATTNTLVKPASPKDASDIAFNNARILELQMDNTWKSFPVNDVKNPNRPVEVTFTNLDRVLGLMRRGESTAEEELSHEDFGKQLLGNDLVGDMGSKGWKISDKKLTIDTKAGGDDIDYVIPVDGIFKEAVKAWVEYHKNKKAVSSILIPALIGVPGETGDEGIMGETGIPEFPYRPTEAPLRSYNRQEILEQIRK